MRAYTFPLVAILGTVLAAQPSRAAEPTGDRPLLESERELRELIEEALDKRPEIVEARAQIVAQSERVPQSRVLPDPSLSLGIQNDGFGGIQIGKMESSWLYVVASQTLPWFGKRDARGALALLGGQGAEAGLQRTLLSVVADVERGYLDLLLARDRLSLLSKLDKLWQQSEAIARVRYEAGEAAQSDLLRAQLERVRIRQRRWSLESEERRRLAVLNRLRGHRLEDSITTERSLADLADPVVSDPEQEALSSEAASPEVKRAVLAGNEAECRVALAKKDRWPDVTLSAGLMPRWGNYGTMWQAGVTLNLPIWSAGRQARVIAENQARGLAAHSDAESVRQLLRQRVHERVELLRSLVEVNRLYRGGLLAQSETTVSSTLLQYQVGRVSFAAVLEALAGYLGDLDGYLESAASAQRVAIAEREISLDAPPVAAVGGGGAAMSDSGSSGGGSSRAPAARTVDEAQATVGGSSMARM
jgi:outer membrane protein, heavy metal efflux system